jgi:acyl-CoA synthetase (AMP-forming)/AMP-acid ligase II
MEFNIASLVDDAARAQPDKAALIHFEKGVYQSYLYKDLLKDSTAYAQGLLALGFKRGSSVALLLKPSKDFFVFTLALFKAGLIPVFLDPAVGLKRLKQCLVEAQIDVFVGGFSVYLASFLLAWRRGKQRHIFPSSFTKLLSLGTKQDSGQASLGLVHTKASDTAAIIFTSGSTGSPKGVIYTHENLAAQLEAVKNLYAINPADIDLPTLPVFTFLDLAFGLTSVLANTNTLRPAKADPAKLTEAIHSFKVSSMFASPALIHSFANYAQGKHLKLPSLKRVISAGAPANPDDLKRFQEMLEPEAGIFTPYGATECLPIASISSQELFATSQQTCQGAGVCVGKPVAQLELRIMAIREDALAKWQDGLNLDQGNIGEIVVKAKQVSKAYKRPDANKLSKLQDTDGQIMHRMGDLGYLDVQGRLWFVGRKAHRVELAKETLYPLQVERVFNEHSCVKRSALVGVKIKGKLEPVICVELKTSEQVKKVLNASQETILKDLQKLALSNPKTKSIKTFLFHKAFPVDVRHNSKIIREELQVWAQKRVYK